ncbi:hypothetical protein KSF_108660 [Reticulibacter mediterranei]|uniref:Tetratricopeptide repeat protein n=1 Tax=Reticulibacter mediterranei TaxID=2778369 RepID=A0A8J3IUG0_9CHLR|nr:FxSxx-COOH system tetratricopeptide repeat protein [Reticulibacter mediterranei]GHP00819.1 hypothetical protein KSF_108660 [Reticulibacter mediterranei]
MAKQTEKKRKYPNNVRACMGTHRVAAVIRDVDIADRTFWRILDERAPIPPGKLESLAKYLGVQPEDLLRKREIWNIPYQRNPFFTGREKELADLHHVLHQNGIDAGGHVAYALCGLGGVGKTQTVLEYAYRYRDEYQAIMWVKADSRENLLAGMLSLASLLELPERDVQDQDVILRAIACWLREQRSWLLIFDNVDDLTLIQEFLPTGCRGHVLLTTRVQALGRIARRLEVEELRPEVGALFLLRRTSWIAPDASFDAASIAERNLAVELARELGGLPLALDQAGAYIEEHQCRLTDYMSLYQTRRRLALLSLRGDILGDHPETVAATWSISFAAVERALPAAADILRVCAFLDPDAIPIELFLDGAKELGPRLSLLASDPFAFDEAVSVLWKYSLIRRNTETRSISLHRLVQIILKETLNGAEQRMWAECVIRALATVFPAEVRVDVWPRCQRLLAHASLSLAYLESYQLAIPEAATLYNQVGYYLRECASYEDAKMFCQRSLSIREQTLGAYHLATAQSLYNLARVYFELSEYAECEHLNRRALSIREQTLPSDHLDIALSLNNLAFLYYLWEGKSEQAESLFQRAIPIFERSIGLEHPRTAHCLSNLALLYASQGRYEESERLLRQVWDIRERLLGHWHLDTARSLQNLAWLYIEQKRQDRYEEADAFLLESLVIRERLVGRDHPQTANSLNHLALLREAQGRYTEAEDLYRQVLAMRRKMMGEDNPKVITTEERYATLLCKLGRKQEAAQLKKHIRAVCCPS